VLRPPRKKTAFRNSIVSPLFFVTRW
jgi:hypothetical protein